VTVLYVERLERSFRRAAGLDIDKEELRRYGDFVHRKNYDLRGTRLVMRSAPAS